MANNYIKVISGNGSGIDTLGLFIFDDRLPEEAARAVANAEHALTEFNRAHIAVRHPARACAWRPFDGNKYDVIGDT